MMDVLQAHLLVLDEGSVTGECHVILPPVAYYPVPTCFPVDAYILCIVYATSNCKMLEETMDHISSFDPKIVAHKGWCMEIIQYYIKAEDNCGSCEQICHEHVLQGTTRDCETYCADYLEFIKNAPSTSLATTSLATTSLATTSLATASSATTSFAPTTGLAGNWVEALLYGLPVAFAVMLILVIIICCCCRKRLRKFCKCCSSEKPPDDVLNSTEMGLNPRGVAPADDGRAERNRLAIEGQNPHPIQKRDEPQDSQTEAEAGQSERTPMIPDPDAGPDLNDATSRPRHEMVYA